MGPGSEDDHRAKRMSVSLETVDQYRPHEPIRWRRRYTNALNSSLLPLIVMALPDLIGGSTA